MIDSFYNINPTTKSVYDMPISDRTGIVVVYLRDLNKSILLAKKELVSLNFRILYSKSIDISEIPENKINKFTFLIKAITSKLKIVLMLVEHNTEKFINCKQQLMNFSNKFESYISLKPNEIQKIILGFFEFKLRVGTLQKIKPSAHFNKFKHKFLFVVTYKNSANFNGPNPKIKQHYGVSSLIAVLLKEGVDVKLITLVNESIEEACKIIKDINPNFLGITSVTSEFSYVASITTELHKIKPDIYMIGGGAHFTLCPHDILATNFDSVCIGEGEEVLQQLINNVPVEKINGLVVRTKKGYKVNHSNRWIYPLDKIPMPEYKIWDDHIPEVDRETISIIISRGCPFKCTYCCNETISKTGKGNYVRYRSKFSIQKEIDYLIKTYPNLKQIFLDSECILPGYKNVNDILELINLYKDKIVFGTNIRLGTFNLDFLNKLKENGINYVNFGIESGCERIRKEVLKRNYTTKDIMSIVKRMHEIGLNFSTYNMIGIPFETVEDFSKTISLNQKINPHNSLLSVFFPYPGTPLYYKSLENEILEDPFFYHWFEGIERFSSVLSLPNFSSSQIQTKFQEFRFLLFTNY